MTVAVPAKPYHHGDLAQASLRVALQLLGENGLDRFSLREVARRLGVSLTALYHYYPDKEALLSTIAEQGMQEFHGALRGAVQKGIETGEDPIVMMGLEYVRFFVDNPHYQDLLFMPAHRANPAITTVWHQTFADLSTSLENRGWNADDVPFLALWLWAGVHGLARMFREGILGCPETCSPDSPVVFMLTRDDLMARVTPLIVAVVTQARNFQKK